EREDVGDAGTLERVDVGAEVHLGGRDPVAAAVTRQKDQPHAVELTGQQVVRRLAERTDHGLPTGALEPLDIVDPAPTDDAETGGGRRRGHGSRSYRRPCAAAIFPA